MFDVLRQPWPWYVAGPLIGLMVPALLYFSNKALGISSSLRHACAAVCPGKIEFLRYDWRSQGLWNLVFVAGVFLGGFLGGYVFANPDPIAISEATKSDLRQFGIADFTGFVPTEVFGWSNLSTLPGLVCMVVGGFLIGFGARWAGGCTSGHAISGLSNLQTASLLAVVGFFAGGLFVTHVIYPLLF